MFTIKLIDDGFLPKEKMIEKNDDNGELIYTIYMIYCKDENIKDTYIGSTENYFNRVGSHISAAKCANRNRKSIVRNENGKIIDIIPQHNTPVYNFINKNGGIKNWSFKKLNEIEFWRTDNIRKQEQVYIDYYKPTMNIKNAYTQPIPNYQ